MKKGIILFDIDRTIFDTDKMSKIFTKLTLQALKTKNIKLLNKVKGKYSKTLERDRDFVPENYFKLVCEEFKFDNIQKLLNIFYSLKYAYIYKVSVYKEVLRVLEKLKTKYNLGIYSEGTKNFQNHKFKSLGLNKYFDKDLVFIFDAKDTREVLNKIPKGAIIIDDKETICEFLTKNGTRAIWLNRKDQRKSDKFETIYSLSELPAIL